jgi:hypothetical protein
MNLQLYDKPNAAVIALQKRLRELNPNARRRTKSQLVAWAIEEGLTEYHTSDKLLQTIRADQPVWVRVDLSETAINAVHNIAEAISYENAYNALAMRGAERLLQNLNKTR